MSENFVKGEKVTMTEDAVRQGLDGQKKSRIGVVFRTPRRNSRTVAILRDGYSAPEYWSRNYWVKSSKKIIEGKAQIKTPQNKTINLMFICAACNRRSIWTNRIHENKMRCSVCSHDEFEIEMFER